MHANDLVVELIVAVGVRKKRIAVRYEQIKDVDDTRR